MNRTAMADRTPVTAAFTPGSNGRDHTKARAMTKMDAARTPVTVRPLPKLLLAFQCSQLGLVHQLEILSCWNAIKMKGIDRAAEMLTARFDVSQLADRAV